MSYLRSINIRNFLSQTSAGLDVYAIEPLPENHKLRFLPNVLLTPHIGSYAQEIRDKMELDAVESVIKY